jgi:hypothetical protein
LSQNDTTNTTTAPPDDFNEYVDWRAAGDSNGEPDEETMSEAAATAAAESAGDPESPEEDHEEQQEERADDTDAADGAEQTPKRKGGFQKRIDRLTREKRELESRVAELEGRGTDTPAPAAAAATETGTEAPATKATDKPTPEEYDSYEEFTEALTEWKLEQREQTRARTEQARAAEQQQKAVVASWNERAEAAREAFPDYDEVLEEANDVPIPPAMQQALLESEHGPELAYKLAQDRAELERIVKLSPVSAARELGRLEATLATGKPAAPKPKPQVTRAPKPVTPIRGGKSGSTPSVYDADLADDYNAWERERQAQLKRK